MGEVALVFHGPINHPATTRLRNAICNAVNGGFFSQKSEPCTKLYLLMDSVGGGVDDGFSLYHFIRSLKAEVVTVNMGLVTSIANVVFLAGGNRIATPHSVFQFHDFEWTFSTPQTTGEMQYGSQQMAIFKAHKKDLFKTRTSLTDADFEALKFLEHPMVMDAGTAKRYGIVQDVAFPQIPAGVPIINADY